MYNNKNITAVIPARKNSKGIPGKNTKLFSNIPLFFHVVQRAKASKYIDNIIVTSDSEEIINSTHKYDKSIIVIDRDPSLAGDLITLDDVIFNAIESQQNLQTDFVITLQPTSPLITSESIDASIEHLVKNDYDTVISVIDDRHLRWTIINKKPFPLYEARVNRQQLPPTYKETGAIISCKTGILLKNRRRIGKNIGLFEINDEEGIDIDSYNDLLLASDLIEKPEIGIITIGDKTNGMGHVFRTLTIAHALKYKVVFFIHNSQHDGILKIQQSNYKVIIYSSLNELFTLLKEHKISLLLNDTLNTTTRYIQSLKKYVPFIVTFEDFGEGSDAAAMTFNALYENSNPPLNHYYGYKYFCLRDEFLFCKRKKINKTVKNILITFGGTDPNNITCFAYNILKNLKYNLKIILGPGFTHHRELDATSKNDTRVEILQSVNKISEHMLWADIIITSNGRTTYEAASLGIPTISICQNEREMKHLFGEVTKTIINLGYFPQLTGKIFLRSFKELVLNYEKRKEINNKMINLDLSKGTKKIIDTIIAKYRKEA
ncbi:MAG: hypothetical protein JW904_03660 [Spirochaetales bacterium]|nr:hypothetical protein [Spirochaetales bacterium]